MCASKKHQSGPEEELPPATCIQGVSSTAFAPWSTVGPAALPPLPLVPLRYTWIWEPEAPPGASTTTVSSSCQAREVGEGEGRASKWGRCGGMMVEFAPQSRLPPHRLHSKIHNTKNRTAIRRQYHQRQQNPHPPPPAHAPRSRPAGCPWPAPSQAPAAPRASRGARQRPGRSRASRGTRRLWQRGAREGVGRRGQRGRRVRGTCAAHHAHVPPHVPTLHPPPPTHPYQSTHTIKALPPTHPSTHHTHPSRAAPSSSSSRRGASRRAAPAAARST